MAVLDASVIVSLFNSRDSLHNATRTWFEREGFQEAPLSIPAICLAEVGGAVARQTRSKKLALEILEKLNDPSLFTIHEIDIGLASEAAQAAIEMGLRGYDSLYVALSLRLKEPLITLDREIEKKATKKLQIKSPVT